MAWLLDLHDLADSARYDTQAGSRPRSACRVVQHTDVKPTHRARRRRSANIQKGFFFRSFCFTALTLFIISAKVNVVNIGVD